MIDDEQPERGSEVPAASVSPLSAGDVVGGYRIERELGAGGMGTVYRAHQIALDRAVALKVITPMLAADPEFRARFVQESRLAASLDHPNVVTVFEAGEDAGRLFVSMRLVDGGDLRRLLTLGGPLAPERAVAIVSQIAAALDAAHAAGMVHRDVKPSNVLVEVRKGQEHAYLCDFGLVKRLAVDQDLTGSEGWVGSVDYLAPEQVRSGTADARTDIYGLGALLFSALTGEVPFPRDDVAAKLYASVNEPTPLPSSLSPNVPPALDEVVRRATDKDPAARYPSAGAMAEAAQAAVGAQAGPGGLTSSSGWTVWPRFDRRRKKALVGGAAALAAAVGLIAATLAGAWSSPHHTSATAGSQPASAKGPATSAALQSQLLTVNDLSGGWSADNSSDDGPDSGSDTACDKTFDNTALHSGAAAAAEASFSNTGGINDTDIGEEIFSYSGPSQATSRLATTFQNIAKACQKVNVAENGQTFTGNGRPLSLGASFGDKSEAYEIDLQADGGGDSDTAVIDVVGVARGSEMMVLDYVFQGDVVEGPTPSDLDDLVTKANAKLPSAAPAQPVAGAPTSFATSDAVPLPDLQTEPEGSTTPVALAGRTAFITTLNSTSDSADTVTGSLEAVDTTSGRTIGQVGTSYDLVQDGGSAPTPPFVTNLDGEQVALAGNVVSIPGQGTTPATAAIEIDALDTQGHRLWQIVSPLHEDPTSLAETPNVTFVGSSGATAVVDLSSGGLQPDETAAFDLQARKLLWRNTTFTPFAVANGAVVGTAGGSTSDDFNPSPLAGLNVQTGTRLWSGQSLSSASGEGAGPSSVVVQGFTGAGTGLIERVDAKTGTVKVLDSYQGNSLIDSASCSFDGQSTLVCSDTTGDQAFAYDTISGNLLWQLPDKATNRIAPNISTVYDGKVYGTTESGAVVLDAHTGRDLNDSVGIAPVAVDSYVAIGQPARDRLDPGAGFFAYAAVASSAKPSPPTTSAGG